MSIKSKVLEFGGKDCVPGPSAMYAVGFPNKIAAHKFINWMLAKYEVLEIGAPITMKDGTFNVRYNAN